VGGKLVDRIKRVDQLDVDAMSLAIKRTSNTMVSGDGLIRGEVRDAIIEQRRWDRV
jgi:hypothetical protein